LGVPRVPGGLPPGGLLPETLRFWEDCDPANVLRLSIDTGNYLTYYLSQKALSKTITI
jgi:hypothetical protein